MDRLISGSFTVEIEGIGPVFFERSRRARYVNITVHQGKGIRVAVPPGISFKKAEQVVREKRTWIQKHVSRIRPPLIEVDGIDRDQGTEWLLKRLRDLAAEHGFFYNRATIRQQRTRWGSCSSKNNINLNIKLFGLPGELIDYVILHELLHTRMRHHRREFWRALDGLVGNARAMDSQLKRYRL